MPRDPRDERFLELAVGAGVLDREAAHRLLEARVASPLPEAIETFLVRTRALRAREVERIHAFARASGSPATPALSPPSPSPAHSPRPISERLTRPSPVQGGIEVPSDVVPAPTGSPAVGPSRSPEPWALASPEPARATSPRETLESPGPAAIPPTDGGIPDTDAPEPRRKLRSGTRSGATDLTRRFGPYEILGEIARGGMGVVYRARKDGTSEVVALKVLLDGSDASDNQVRRFEREIKAGLALDHHGIVKVVDGGRAEGRLFFTMEMIDGDSFDKLMPKMDVRARVSVVEKSCHAVHAAHEHGIVHRDLKPQNILVGKDGEPKVADFGLAKSVDRQSRLTKTGALVGTPYYMSPEQARGELEKIDRRSDVYALGAILYQALTGALPFTSDSALGLLGKIVNEEPSDPRTLAPECPPALAAIALKALEKEPAARYQTALELAADLASWLEGGHVSAIGPSAASILSKQLRRKQRTILLGSLTGAALVVLALALVLFVRGRRQRTESEAHKDLAERRAELDTALRTGELLLAEIQKPHGPDLRDRLKKVLGDLEKLERAPDETPFSANRSVLRSEAKERRLSLHREQVEAAFLVVATGEGRESELAGLLPRLLAFHKARPEREDVRVALAQARERLGAPEEALALLEEALGDEASALLLERTGELRLLLGDARGAAQVLERAVQREPEAARARGDLVRALLETDPPRAERLARELEKDRPRDLDARALVGEATLVRDPGAAIDSLRRLEREAMADPDLARRVADVLLRAERPEEAIVAMSRAAELSPRDPRPLAGRAEARFLSGDAPGAAKDFAAAAALAPAGSPARARVLAREARLLDLAGDPRAATIAREALDERPGDLSLRLALLLAGEPKPDDLAQLAKDLGSRSGAATAWAALARARLPQDPKAQDPRGALEAARHAVELAPASAESLAAVALAKTAAADPEALAARTAAHEAFAADPGDAARLLRSSCAHDRLALRFEKLPDSEPAVADDDARAASLLAWSIRAAPWSAAPLVEKAHRLRRAYDRRDRLGVNPRSSMPPRDAADLLEKALPVAGRDANAEAFQVFVWMEIEEGMYAPRVEERANAALELAERKGDRAARAMALAARGDARRHLGRPAEGLADLEAALALDPHPAVVWRWKARALEALGRAAEASDAEREAEERGPRRDEVVKALMNRVYDTNLNRNKDATATYPDLLRAIDLDPTDGHAIWQFGLNLLVGGANRPEDPYLFVSRGLYYDTRGVVGTADTVRGFTATFDLKGEADRYDARVTATGWDALWTSAILHALSVESQDASKANVQSALLALERALSADPTATTAILFRGLCRAHQGDSALARADAERVLRYLPKLGFAYFFWALAEARDGHAKEAKEHLAKAFELDDLLKEKLARFPELEKLK